MNPSTGVMMDVPAKTVVKFKPSAGLRALVEAD
jgi:nucleoid DNA-binding protein